MANIALIVDNILSDSGVPITYSTSGTSGTSGANGAAGSSGTSGANGAAGSSGTSGARGTSGTSGTKGTSGTAGTSGSSGSSGAGTISGTTNTVAKFTNSTTVGNSNITDDGTTITLGSNTAITGNFKFSIRSNQSSYGQAQIGATTAGGEASLAFVGGNSSGIGTSAPSSGDGTGAVWAIGSNVFGIGTTVFGIGNAGAGTAVFRVTSAGVGTFLSTVQATSRLFLQRASAGASTLIQFKNEAAVDRAYIKFGGTDEELSFYAGGGGTENLRITSAGVGTFSSTVRATNGGVDGAFVDAFVGVYSSNNNEQNAIQTSVSSVAQSSGFRFEVSNGGGSAGRTDVVDFVRDRAIFYTNVGINTTSPAVNFHVNGKSYIGTMTNYTPAVHIRGGYYGGPRLQVYGLDADANGWMGLGTDMSNSPYELSIYYPTNGSSSVTFGRYDGTATQYGGYTTTARLSNAGTWTVAGDVVAYGSPSDVSLKQNIKPIEDALEKILELEGVSFDWIEETEVNSLTGIKEDLGFIAQQVQKVIPKLVRENSNGKLSLRDKGITPYLVEAIKEQQKQIEELKTIINGLTK